MVSNLYCVGVVSFSRIWKIFCTSVMAWKCNLLLYKHIYKIIEFSKGPINSFVTLRVSIASLAWNTHFLSVYYIFLWVMEIVECFSILCNTYFCSILLVHKISNVCAFPLYVYTKRWIKYQSWISSILVWFCIFFRHRKNVR